MMRVPVQPILATLFVVALASAHMADAGCIAGQVCTFSQNCNTGSFGNYINTTVYCCGTSSSSCLAWNNIVSVQCGAASYGYSDSKCDNQLPKAATAVPRASMAAWVTTVVALVVMMITA